MYQTMSPDNMTLTTSTRKSNTSNSLKSSNKEDQNGQENGTISSSNGNNTPPTTTSTTFEGNHSNNNHKSLHQPQHHHNHNHNHNHNHYQQQASSSSAGQQSRESSPCIGGGCDMLLQWGPRKRSRCSRTEGRSMVSLVLEKHSNTTHHIMPPPNPPSGASTSSNGHASRTGSSSRNRPHGLLFLSSKTRNIVDHQMGSNSTPPSRNGGGNSRPISRSTVGKRSPSCIEKNDSSNKKVSSSGTIRKVKSDDCLVPSGNDLAHGDHHHEHGGGPASTMVRSPVADAEKPSDVIEWPRIYLSLSRKEKEDDFYAMKGTKLPHRPKKRAKAVDRALQYCFPGLWLSDLTRARYEVRERKSTKKPKRRGLKGLENMESESE